MATDRRTYVRLHDGLPDHPKIVGLTDPAFRLFIEALCYCSRHLTDGLITDAAMKKLGSAKACRELASAGLLEGAASGWRIHDYLLHQRSAAEVEELVEKRRTAGSLGGKAKAKAVASAKTDAKQTPATLVSKRVAETETQSETEQQPQPSAVVDASTTTMTQRSKTITDAYSQAVNGMCKWPAVNAIVMRAIRSGRYGDADIVGALLRMAADNRPVTIDTLRVELDGLPTLRPPQQSRNTSILAGAYERAQNAERTTA